MENEDLQKKLLERRKALGLTQREAAARSGIPFGTYVFAEIYGKMGFKVRHDVLSWLIKSESKPSPNNKAITHAEEKSRRRKHPDRVS
jgi:transcriptional regulator with XRE-family HTH domain